MKRSVTKAGLITAVTIAIYPLLDAIADAERGYNAIGGEEAWLILGGVIALLTIIRGYERVERRLRKQKRTTCPKASRL
jgi:hypothetical protein